MRYRKGNSLSKVALALAVAAIAAPTAQAGLDTPVRPDDRAYRVSPVGVLQAVVRPDDRADARGPGLADQTQLSVRPDDRAVRVSPVIDTTVFVRPDDRATRVSPVGDTATAVRPDDRAERIGPAIEPQAAVRPDDRAQRISPVTEPQLAVRPDDRAQRLSPVSAPAPVQIAVKPGDFDWADAGIGAAAAFGLMLVAAGAMLLAQHHRRGRLAL